MNCKLKFEESGFHLVLNPDVIFESIILNELIEVLEKDATLSMVAPKVLFPNKEIQYTARKYPSISEQIFRFLGVFEKNTSKSQYRNCDLNKSFYPDFIHGGFMLFKTEDFIKLNGFDERYFLYMEDVDICKEIDKSGKKKIYYPHVQVFHELRRASNKELKLFFIHILSMIKYYKKWGL